MLFVFIQAKHSSPIYPSKAYFLLLVTLSFAKLTAMSSPHKQFKLPSHQGRKLNEPLLPLHLALAWIIIRVFPINIDLQSLPVYSSQFTQRVLHIVAREILDVSVHSNHVPQIQFLTDCSTGWKRASNFRIS